MINQERQQLIQESFIELAKQEEHSRIHIIFLLYFLFFSLASRYTIGIHNSFSA